MYRQPRKYDESKYRNGDQYLIHGMDTVTESYILSTMDKTTKDENSSAAEDTYTVKYYQLLKNAEKQL